MISPRVGFNWDVKGDRTMQLRGGTGVLTGRIPFVWLSNTISNNGLFFGQFNSTNVPFTNSGDGFPYDFTLTPFRLPADAPASFYSDLENGLPPLISNPLDPNYGRPSIVPAVNVVAKDFKFPQVWRTNLAIDQQLPFGMVGTLELIYTKDINAMYLRDANLRPATATLAGDGRPLYGAAGGSRQIVNNDRRLSGDVGQALVLDNTNKGYQWSVTGQLRKNFNKNAEVSIAYTYTDSRELNPQNGSTAGGIYNQQANVLGANSPELSYANTLTPHRIIAFGNYKIEYSKFMATTIGMTFEGRSGANFSYLYNGDVNSDGNAVTDLIYIPASQDEILLVPSNANDTRTVDEIWN
ncbi:MAG: TonB-dependent receptor, partial [Cyclobacteriaceae bacterium]|nr:TonB-dependent receptor [Cyclobacteriaceae bacterium]